MHKFFTHFWRVAPCLFAIIIDYMGYGLVYPLVTVIFNQPTIAIFPHLDTGHLRDFYMGMAFLLYPLGMFFGASFLGDLSDAWGRRKVILLSVGGIGISFIIMGFAIVGKSILFFLLGRLLSGLMAGSQPLSQAAVADVSTPKSKPWSMALVSLTNCIGLVFGPVIAGTFSEKWFVKEVGFSLPFFISAFLALVAFIWIYSKFKETYTPKQKTTHIDWSRPVRIFIEAFEEKRVRILALVFLIFQVAVAIYYQTSAIFLYQHFQYSSSLIGYFYGWIGLSFVVATLFLYPITLRYWSPVGIVIFGLGAMGIFQIGLAFIRIEWLFWADIFVMATFNILGWTPMLSLFSNSVSENRQGWVMGIFASTVAIAFIVAGLSTNLLNLLGPDGIIFAGGVLSIVSCVILFSVRKRFKDVSVKAA